MLLDSGCKGKRVVTADAHHKNKANRSPIDFAQQIEDVDMVKILLG